MTEHYPKTKEEADKATRTEALDLAIQYRSDVTIEKIMEIAKIFARYIDNSGEKSVVLIKKSRRR